MMKKESHGLMKLCSLAGNWTCAHCERGPVKILFEGNISRQRKKKKNSSASQPGPAVEGPVVHRVLSRYTFHSSTRKKNTLITNRCIHCNV